jgi:hypothetical protein
MSRSISPYNVINMMNEALVGDHRPVGIAGGPGCVLNIGDIIPMEFLQI